MTNTNIKMVDAFNQTDMDWSKCLKFDKNWMENINVDKIIKQAQHINKMFAIDKSNTNDEYLFEMLKKNTRPNTKSILKNVGCGMIGGGSATILPIFASYFMMNGMILLVLSCMLTYIIYLKLNNTCINSECCFSLNKNIVSQMKHDSCNFIKIILRWVLNSSVCIIKSFSKITSICYTVYSKGVQELIQELDNNCDSNNYSCHIN
jgi:hypothetical protein